MRLAKSPIMKGEYPILPHNIQSIPRGVTLMEDGLAVGLAEVGTDIG
jgi:hypothetical protein